MSYLEQRRDLKNGKPPEKQKRVSQIKPFSKKRQTLNKEYAAKSQPYWKEKQCAINAPGCTGRAQGIHHMKGKTSKELLLDEKYWLAACNHCNHWIEQNDKSARMMGFKLSKFSK